MSFGKPVSTDNEYWKELRRRQKKVLSELYLDYDPERHDEFLRRYGNKEMLKEVEDAKKAGLWSA